MLQTEKNLFEKFEKLARSVKQEFKNKGLVIPMRKPDGSIQVGEFLVVKRNTFYYIKDSHSGNEIAGPLNLAQTAIVVANDLALGKMADPVLLNQDQWYGYKEFDEQVATASAEKAKKDHDVDRADFSLYKASVAREKKVQYKKTIESRFNKLYRIV